MATYTIKATYEYEAEVEANNEAEAEKLFLEDLNLHYVGTDSFEIEKIAECVECGETDIYAVEDYTCDTCADNEDEEQL